MPATTPSTSAAVSTHSLQRCRFRCGYDQQLRCRRWLRANQDKIDLSGLGVTAANFARGCSKPRSGGNTHRTVRENGAASAIQGTIQINGVTNAKIDVTDFTLAAAAPPVFGVATAAANTITGNAAANTINGLGGNDTLSGAGGDDVINGGEGADILNGGDGNDTLSGGAGSNTGTYADNFNVQSYANSTGTVALAGSWSETGAGETPTSPTAGDIEINGNRLRFDQNIDGGEAISARSTWPVQPRRPCRSPTRTTTLELGRMLSSKPGTL